MTQQGRTGAVPPGLGRSGTGQPVPPAVLSSTVIAEKALLGCVLIDDFEVWGELEECPITADDFLEPHHRAIWRAFMWLKEQGMEVTCPSTAFALSRLGLMDATDGWIGHPWTEPFLITLMTETFSAKSSLTFLRMVKHYSDMRSAPTPRTARETEL
jgi:replicative DNA helicase